MAREPKLLMLMVLLIVLTFVFPRARVLTLPIFFTGCITALFWSARASADRQAEKEKEGGS